MVVDKTKKSCRSAFILRQTLSEDINLNQSLLVQTSSSPVQDLQIICLKKMDHLVENHESSYWPTWITWMKKMKHLDKKETESRILCLEHIKIALWWFEICWEFTGFHFVLLVLELVWKYCSESLKTKLQKRGQKSKVSRLNCDT